MHATKHFSVEFILINDGDKEIVLPALLKANFKIYKNEKSGVASARNLGARMATHDHLIFMDDDMWMQEDNLDNLRQAIALHPDSCINLNWIYPPELSEQIRQQKFGRYLAHYGFTSLKGWSKGLSWSDDEIFETEGITSQFLYMPKSVFSSVGGYNENFPHAGFEDYDFAVRLKKSGVKSYLSPKSFLFHNEADRVDAKNWLARKRRGGETRKYAVVFGYKHLELHYNLIKTIIYRVCIICYPVLFFTERLIPNKPLFDKLYFRLINLLLGAHSFEGYHKKTPID